jgi:uncharacterized membrane protein
MLGLNSILTIGLTIFIFVKFFKGSQLKDDPKIPGNERFKRFLLYLLYLILSYGIASLIIGVFGYLIPR